MTTRRMQFLASSLLAFALTPALILPARQDDLRKTRSVAEAQHEIVVILIGKKEFDKAAEEANKIFQLKWPEDQEPVLLKELLDFSKVFADKDQPSIAVRLLDSNLAFFKIAKHKAAIWKEKGYLLEKKLGKHDEALECFRQAQRLELIKAS
jgi:tetratricopeptide (TPR) repeat protein